MALKVGDLIPIGQGGYSLLSNVTGFKVDSVDDGVVRLTWKDPEDVIVDGVKITSWEGTQIRRKQGNYPVNEKDGELVVDNKVRNQYANTPFEDTGLTNDVEYFYMAFPYTDKNVFTVDSANRVIGIPNEFDDPNGIGGLYSLIAGDKNAGYFGTVPASEFIDGDTLANEIGLIPGSTQHSNTEWLKFAIDGKIILSPMKTIRHSITWTDIDDVNAVYGNKTITIGGLTYKIRLWKGANNDPTTRDDVLESEWNRLMLPIHIKAPANWENPEYGGITKDWGINFTDADLLTSDASGYGSYTWCQETLSTNPNRRIARGYVDAAYVAQQLYDNYAPMMGWRPVLELVEE